MIEADDQFDFLNDIVSKVAEGPETAAKDKKVKDDEASSEVDSAPAKKKRTRAKKEKE